LKEDILVFSQLKNLAEDSIEGSLVVVDGQVVEGLEDACELVDVHPLSRGHQRVVVANHVVNAGWDLHVHAEVQLHLSNFLA
jgi:hypothetical protein